MLSELIPFVGLVGPMVLGAALCCWVNLRRKRRFARGRTVRHHHNRLFYADHRVPRSR